MEWIIEGLATIPMEYYMGIVPVVLLVLGFPIFIILLATASIVLIVHQAVPPMAMHINMFGSVSNESPSYVNRFATVSNESTSGAN